MCACTTVMAFARTHGARLNAPRIRATCRAPTCRRAFIGPGSPRRPAGRRHAWSLAPRHRLGHQLGETSSSDCHCRGFEGSCTACHSVRVPGRGWRRPPGVARSPSGVPFDRRPASRSRLRAAGTLFRGNGIPLKCRRQRSSGFRFFETLRVWRGGKWINERPIARSRMRGVLRGFARCWLEQFQLHLLNISNGIHSSTENESFGSQTPQRAPSDAETRFRQAQRRAAAGSGETWTRAVDRRPPTDDVPSGEHEPMVRGGG